MNVLTFDVEEWFHLLDNDSTRTEQQWNDYEVRIYENMERIFRILEETDTKATFFIIGWVARKYPDIVRRIAEKYEIGSHTMNHQLIWQQGREAFRRDLESSVKLLEDITGKPVRCFRAPGFSIRESEPWAFEVMRECGIDVDCSVFPAHHAHGGMPSYRQVVPSVVRYNGCEIKEFPVSVKKMAGKNIIFSGGGYFRLFPYFLIKKWSSGQPYLMSYIHPRDLDAGQPVVEGLPLARRFKSYVGLKSAADKLTRYLNEVRFSDVASAVAATDWKNAPVVDLGREK